MNSIGFNPMMTLSLPWTNGPTVHFRWTDRLPAGSPLDEFRDGAHWVKWSATKLGDDGDGVTVRIFVTETPL